MGILFGFGLGLIVFTATEDIRQHYGSFGSMEVMEVWKLFGSMELMEDIMLSLILSVCLNCFVSSEKFNKQKQVHSFRCVLITTSPYEVKELLKAFLL